MSRPLTGIRVIELGGLGPGPHGAVVLASLGADVLRIVRPGSEGLLSDVGHAQLYPGTRDLAADLGSAEGRATVLSEIAAVDVVIDGFRPGVAERLGVGPDEALALNPRLVYARMTGWGQDGPLAGSVGHDINYLSVTGVLHAIGRADRPVPPLNLVGDFGGGSMFLVTGVLAALLERHQTGRGQVIDVAMVDGIGMLAQLIWAMRGAGAWTDERGANLLDGGAPFYDTYPCSDGRFVAVGALEPRFYQALLEGLELARESLPDQYDRAGWPALRAAFSATFATRTRDEWAAAFEATEACVTPVLTFDEATRFPHLVHRGAFTTVDGVTSPSPAPRFGGHAS